MWVEASGCDNRGGRRKMSGDKGGRRGGGDVGEGGSDDEWEEEGKSWRRVCWTRSASGDEVAARSRQLRMRGRG